MRISHVASLQHIATDFDIVCVGVSVCLYLLSMYIAHAVSHKMADNGKLQMLPIPLV